MKESGTFEGVYENLSVRWPQNWRLEKRILHRLDTFDAKATLYELAEMARVAADLGEYERDLSFTVFQKAVRHGIACIRAEALRLFLRSKNPEGFTIKNPSGEVNEQIHWTKELEDMRILMG